jgi:hypothetical protein
MKYVRVIKGYQDYHSFETGSICVVVGEDKYNEIFQFMKENDMDYYNAREILREKAYGGKPPEGFQSWGDYWKSY